ncbi:hypothetical protein HNQ64_001359 [Prosthecobacter dejongeii]|uniref:Uncharacterized protein n=1 Tax=Prosthecobacter dejongeii TaxID=48465 RepID=A0A7W7YJA6_9BACT|nr:hypothetical protein [Prosthecobacter dejongeii]
MNPVPQASDMPWYFWPLAVLAWVAWKVFREWLRRRAR